MCRNILRHGADGVLRIFVALEYPSPLAGFEPVNLGSNGKHDNH
jgi:hypothetical protein